MKGLIRFTLAAVAAITMATPAVALAQAAKPVIAVLYFDNNSMEDLWLALTWGK